MITPAIAIKINGANLDDLARKSITQVSCDLQLTMASEISLAIHDPNYKITDACIFGIGDEIDLEIGSASAFQRLMLGEIVSLEPELSATHGAVLAVRAYDKSYRLRRNHPARPAFLSARDSDIAAQIAQDAGLQAETEQTPIIHEYIQQTGSDWRFLKSRAQANGYELFVQFDTLFFRRPPEGAATTHSVKRNTDLLQLRLRLATFSQPDVHVVRGWDQKQKQPLVAKTEPDTSGIVAANGQLGAKMASEAFGERRTLTFDSPIASQDEAENLAKAQFFNKTRNFISGEGICIGKPEMKAGDMLDVQNMGENFSGMYHLARVTHAIDHNGFRTHFAIERPGL